MKVCIGTATNLLISSCSTSDENTLRAYANQYGYLDENIEIKDVTAEEYQAILDAQVRAEQPPTSEEQLEQRLFEIETAILEANLLNDELGTMNFDLETRLIEKGVL